MVPHRKSGLMLLLLQVLLLAMHSYTALQIKEAPTYMFKGPSSVHSLLLGSLRTLLFACNSLLLPIYMIETPPLFITINCVFLSLDY